MGMPFRRVRQNSKVVTSVDRLLDRLRLCRSLQAKMAQQQWHLQLAASNSVNVNVVSTVSNSSHLTTWVYL